MREDIRRLESQIEDDDDDLENLRDGAGETCERIKRAMDPENREFSLNAAQLISMFDAPSTPLSTPSASASWGGAATS